MNMLQRKVILVSQVHFKWARDIWKDEKSENNSLKWAHDIWKEEKSGNKEMKSK